MSDSGYQPDHVATLTLFRNLNFKYRIGSMCFLWVRSEPELLIMSRLYMHE